MNKIDKVLASEIKDSRGNPTLRVSVYSGIHSGTFDVPSGASTGAHEAHELRDENGLGVSGAVQKINDSVALALIGESALDQKKIDKILLRLDGTQNKENLGGNSTIGVSLACAKLAAEISGLELFEYLRSLAEMKPSRVVPYLYMNLINGGKHTHSQTRPAFQEYHVVPDTMDVAEGVEMGLKIQEFLRSSIEKDFGVSSLILGDEGGYAMQTNDIRKPLEYLKLAIENCGYQGKIRLALDVAANSFYDNGFYSVDGVEINRKELLSIYEELMTEYNLLSIEDPFEEEDFYGFKELRDVASGSYVVGDDITVTNKELLERANESGSVNALIIKPNQIGTLTETLDTMMYARENNIECIVSHRSGETMDDFISDLAYAFGCFGIKAGSPIKPERMIKYKRLEKISKDKKFIN